MVIKDEKEKKTLEDYITIITRPWLKNKVTFFRLMAIAQKAWLWMRETLVLLKKSENHPWMKKLLENMIEMINMWESLYETMKKFTYFFTMEEIELIKSSETMWNMPEVLQNIAEELENFQKIKAKVKNAMMYPIVVIIIAIFAIIILLVKVMPTMVSLFPSRDMLPWITLFMLDASDYLQRQWYMLVIYWVSAVFAYTFSYKNILAFKIFMDRVFLTVHPIKDVVIKFNLYRFSKLLWDFSEAWVSPTVALQQISEVLKNYHYREKVKLVKHDIEIWLWFTDSMEDSYLFDPILVQIIWVWEETWNVGEVLKKMAEFYREELDAKIEWMTKMMEPLLMAFVAIIVWVIVASIFLPMWELIWTI